MALVIYQFSPFHLLTKKLGVKYHAIVETFTFFFVELPNRVTKSSCGKSRHTSNQ